MEELTPELNYRFTIIEAINFMNQTKNELFLKLVNIAMNGEFIDSNSIFEVGDEINVDASYFKNCKDDNIHGLLRLLSVTNETIDYLLERNDIDENELGIKVE